jgi:ankyrin repeat protein
MQTNDANTALIIACDRGRIETAKVLLDHGAYVNQQNKVFEFYC